MSIINNSPFTCFYYHVSWNVSLLDRTPSWLLFYNLGLLFRLLELTIVPWKSPQVMAVWYDGICPTKIKIWWQPIFLICPFLSFFLFPVQNLSISSLKKKMGEFFKRMEGRQALDFERQHGSGLLAFGHITISCRKSQWIYLAEKLPRQFTKSHLLQQIRLVQNNFQGFNWKQNLCGLERVAPKRISCFLRPLS